jgi:hypothetical protein
MDVYTTSFTYPRRSRHFQSAASSLDFPTQEFRPAAGTDSYSVTHHGQLQHVSSNLGDASAASDAEALQKLAMMAMTLHGCHVAYFLADQGRGWNFQITGAYQQVMVARGMILKECPIQVRIVTPLGRLRLSGFTDASKSTVQRSKLLDPKSWIPLLRSLRSRVKSVDAWTTLQPKLSLI